MFLNMLQIISILDLTESPFQVPASQSVPVFAFSKLWIPMLTSVATQVLIFGAAFLLRLNEQQLMDRSSAASEEQFRKRMCRAKTKRVALLALVFTAVLVA